MTSKLNPKLKIIFISIVFIGACLRLYNLTSVPKGLHGDELGVGYNAWLLSKSLQDEYGNRFPLVFRTDFTPVIFYLTIPYVAIMGLNEFSTRLPTALIGIATVTIIYFLVYELFKNKRLAFLTMLGFALSSWHIRTSRIALELTWALFFQLSGIIFFIKYIKHNKYVYLVLSFIFMAISLFSYHSTKMTTPLLILGLCIIYRQHIIKKKSISKILIQFLFGIVIPIAVYFYIQPLKNTRFIGINVITLWKSTLPSSGYISIQHLFNLFWTIISNYLKHFDPNIIFFDNSKLRYFQLDGHGLFYVWQLPLIFLGLWQIWEQRKYQHLQFVLYWLIIAPLPAAFTTGVPYANIGRILLILPMIELISAYGLLIVFKKTQQLKIINNLFLSLMIFIISAEMFTTFWDYFSIQPDKYAAFWGYNYKQAILTLPINESQLERIVITNKNPQSYMYLLFYSSKDSYWLFSQERKKSDLIGYQHIGNYEFRPIDWKKDQNLNHSLFIGTESEIPLDAAFYNVTSFKNEDTIRIAINDHK